MTFTEICKKAAPVDIDGYAGVDTRQHDKDIALRMLERCERRIQLYQSTRDPESEKEEF